MSDDQGGTGVVERYDVRDARSAGYDWLPDWCVVDTVEQVRVAAYDDEGDARKHCAELNGETL